MVKPVTCSPKPTSSFASGEMRGRPGTQRQTGELVLGFGHFGNHVQEHFGPNPPDRGVRKVPLIAGVHFHHFAGLGIDGLQRNAVAGPGVELVEPDALDLKSDGIFFDHLVVI